MNTDNPQHLVFIQSYLSSGNKRAAYKTAYPDIADGDSLRVASNRLFRQLKPQIDALEERATRLALDELMNDAKERIKAEVCTMQQRREVLAAIILGRTKQKRHIRIKDSIVEVEDDITPNAIIRAIDLDSRLAANKYKEKGIEYPKLAEPLLPVVRPVNPDDILPLEQRLEKYPYGHLYWKNKRIKLHGDAITRYGFDMLDEGIPYLKGELTEAYKAMRLEKEVENFKRLYPNEAEALLASKNAYTILPDDAPVAVAETKRNNEYIVPAATDTQPPETDLWATYLKLDSNTRALHPQDRKQKETWFRAISQKQQLKLIALYKMTG